MALMFSDGHFQFTKFKNLIETPVQLFFFNRELAMRNTVNTTYCYCHECALFAFLIKVFSYFHFTYESEFLILSCYLLTKFFFQT